MEPPKLTPSSPSDDSALESLLQEAHPLPSDADFTARVLAALPPPRSSSFVFRRAILYIAAVLIAVAFSPLRNDLQAWRGFVGALAHQWQALPAAVLTWLTDPWVLWALGITLLSLLVAWTSPEVKEITFLDPKR